MLEVCFSYTCCSAGTSRPLLLSKQRRRQAMEERIRGGETSVFGCLKATCCSDPNTSEGKCRLPTPKRAARPVGYKRFELLECFPYYFEGTWLLDKFACIKWLVRYNPRWLLADVIAGLTVGLMVVPQALAYATIARLPHSVSYPSLHKGTCIPYMHWAQRPLPLRS